MSLAGRIIPQRLRRLRALEAIAGSTDLGQISWLNNHFGEAHGHRLSVESGKPVDRHGDPLPWYTYPAIEYLIQLDWSEASVLEFGSGNSSAFWAKRSAGVSSVENDPKWHAELAPRLRQNQRLELRTDAEQYASFGSDAGKQFDVIIVDGSYRKKCAERSRSLLNANGVVILDNSDWHPQTAGFLRESDLIQIDFTGVGPINRYAWTTSLFLSRGFRPKPLTERLPAYGIGALIQVADPE